MVSTRLFPIGLCFLLPLSATTFFSETPLSGKRVASLHSSFGHGDSGYELRLGKTIDILQNDYQTIFKSLPDFEIYTKDITLRDPSGIRTHGLSVYQKLFELLHKIANLVIKDCHMDYRFTYVPQDRNIVVHWKLQVNFRVRKLPFFMEAYSYYAVDQRAQIYSHVIDQLVINDQPLQPPYNIPAKYMQYWTERKPMLKQSQPSFFWGFWKRFFSTCETKNDCSEPMECCDYGLYHSCCNDRGKYATYPHPYFARPIRVPVETTDF